MEQNRIEYRRWILIQVIFNLLSLLYLSWFSMIATYSIFLFCSVLAGFPQLIFFWRVVAKLWNKITWIMVPPKIHLHIISTILLLFFSTIYCFVLNKWNRLELLPYTLTRYFEIPFQKCRKPIWLKCMSKWSALRIMHTANRHF